MSLINDALKRASQAEKTRAPQPPRAPLPQPVMTAGSHRKGAGGLIAAVVVVLLAGSATLIYYGFNRQPQPDRDGQPVVNNSNPGNSTPGSAKTMPPEPPPAKANPIVATVNPVPPPTPTVKTNPSAITVQTTLPRTNTVAVVKPPTASPPVPKNPAVAVKPPEVSTPKATTPPPTPNPAVAVAPPAPVVQPPAVQTNVVAVVAPAPSPVKPPQPPAVTPPPSNPVVAVTPPAPVAPTTPPPANVEFPPLKLQGIFYRSKNPSALINGRTVFVGDNIGEVKIQAIEQRSVKVELNGATKVLWL